MATQKQTAAARRNIVKAKDPARRKRTIPSLPGGPSSEDRTREQLYDLAQKRNIRGRSKMGKWDLIRALRAS
jgi:hypothetical protein